MRLFLYKFGRVGVLLLFCFATSRAQTSITIDSGDPMTNFSLQHHLCYASEQLHPDTEMILSPGVHFVDQGDPCIVRNTDNLTIRGANGQSDAEMTEIRCTSNILGRNFIFLNITGLHIANIKVINCGRSLPDDLPNYVNGSNVYFGPGQKGVFLFGYISNLTLDHVVVDHCFGYGFIGVNVDSNTVFHSVTVTNTNNFDNILCVVPPSDLSCSGSGAVLLFFDLTEQLLSNSTLTVINSTFEQNENHIPLSYLVTVHASIRISYKTGRLPLTGATGLAVYTLQKGYNVDVQVSGSKFLYNDGYSASLLMVAYNTIQDVSFQVDDCEFIGNIGRFKSRGGGMLLLQVNYLDALQTYPTYPHNVHEILKVTRSNFFKNIAEVGGGMYIYTSPQNASDICVVFDSVSFIGNIATSGSALAFVTIQSTIATRSLHILLEDIKVGNNTFPSGLYTTTSTIDNSATLLFVRVQNVTITGRDTTHGSKFFNNNPGVILASGSNVYLKGTLNFYDNLAFRGGAIAMIDYSILFFYEGSSIVFQRNRALSHGGAIYANSLGPLDACIIQFIGPSRISSVEEVPSLNLSIKFENNMATDGGNSIFANPIFDCAYLPESSLFQSTFIADSDLIYSEMFHFHSSVNNGVQELSSRPEKLCFCNTTEFRVDYCLGELRTVVSAVPGQEFEMYVIPIDKINSPVSSIMYTEFNTPELQLSSSQTTWRLSGISCDPVTFQVHGLENSNGDLNLYAVLGGFAITIDITLKKCPPGFSIGSQKGLLKCLCDVYITDGLSTSCNSLDYTIVRPGNAWLGVVEYVNTSNVVFVQTCPVGHCNRDITDVDLRIPDSLCESGRTGVLCGACKPGLSIVFGSQECHRCSNYSILTIIFYAILGILLVVVLFILNLTVTQGTVIGLIFYANLVSVNMNIFNHNNSQDFVFVFISLINLELGFPMCFFDGMTEVVKVGFQFIFPAYLLLLSVGIIYLVRWSSRMQKLTASNGIHVLATLLYLSYAKILRTVIDSLTVVTLRSEVQQQVIWLHDGNIEYFTHGHIGLVIAAVSTLLLFLGPYTIMLLFIKLFQRHGMLRLKPILDAYGGPYKNQYTFWIGLRLLTLAVMYSIYAISGTDDPSLTLMLELIFIILFVFWQALSKPFKNYFIELLDLFFTMNFIVIVIASLHLLNVDTETVPYKQKVLVEVLISFVFIAFCGIIMFHIIKALHRITEIGKKMDELQKQLLKWNPYWFFKNKMKGEPRSTLENNSVKLTMAKTGNHSVDATQTTVSLDYEQGTIEASDVPRGRKLTIDDFSKLREPVLGD